MSSQLQGGIPLSQLSYGKINKNYLDGRIVIVKSSVSASHLFITSGKYLRYNQYVYLNLDMFHVSALFSG
jgi:hypothetical protein